MDENASFYSRQGEVYESHLHTRGPWSKGHQHGGPPAALLARAIEQEIAVEPELRVLRISFELLRPVPIAPLRVTTHPIHQGRKLQVWEAMLCDAGDESGDKPLVRARAVVVREAALDIVPAKDCIAAPPGPQQSQNFEFDFFSEAIGYNSAMALRLARGTPGAGAVAMWMRMRIPLVKDETPSALQRVVVAADSGNGISACLDPVHYTFINPDLTVYLHRPPQGEWICLDAYTQVQAEGVGLADTRLYDVGGAIGRSDQSLIIQARA